MNKTTNDDNWYFITQKNKEVQHRNKKIHVISGEQAREKPPGF